MKGKLIKIEERWMVGTVCYADLWSNYMPLHLDDESLWMFAELNEEWKDKLDGKEVEFEIVIQEETSKHYAKLIPSKEQQKELIKEIMDLDAKDGLYEDDVEKLAAKCGSPFFDEKSAEYACYGFKQGYNKAKETLYTEGQVREAIDMARAEKISEEWFRPILKYSPNEIIQSLKKD
jgi:hypothetical protein